MNILITGAKGFVGKNLCCNLRNIMEGKNRTRPGMVIDAIFEYDIDTELIPILRFWTNTARGRILCSIWQA